MKTDFPDFASFYPYYLSEHRNGTCRALHFAGTSAVLALAVLSATVGPWWLILLLGPAGYGPAWIGHFFFEKNRPATFDHPFYSLLADFVMYADILRLRVPLFGDLPQALMEPVAPQ